MAHHPSALLQRVLSGNGTFVFLYNAWLDERTAVLGPIDTVSHSLHVSVEAWPVLKEKIWFLPSKMTFKFDDF